MHFLLLTTANQTPILVGEAGVTIEPEVATNRSVVLLPSANREKPKIIVQEAFFDIRETLRAQGRVTIIAAPQPEQAAAPEPEPSIADLISMPEADEIEFDPKPEEKKRNRRAKKEVV